MANTAQARKRARQAVKQNEHNSSLRSKLRTSIKAVRKAIETGDKLAAAKVFAATQSTIDMYIPAISAKLQKLQGDY